MSVFQRTLFILSLAFLPVILPGCSSDTKELLDLVLDDPDQEELDRSRLGINNFFLRPEFGSICQQFLELRDTLGLRFVRVLMAWTDDVQPTPGSTPNFGFFDDIIDCIPSGVDVLVVAAHTPNWMSDASNWTSGGNPRATWVDRWLRVIVERYAGRPGIVGWEVWNEPDLTVVPSDSVLGLEAPENYFELLSFASTVLRNIDPARLIVIAATESIQQDFPNTLNYNRTLRDLGAGSLVDVWNIHYYGEQFERVVQGGGVADFLNSLGMLIWITETGEQGPNQQKSYVRTTIPFLREKIPGIDRVYIYRYGDNAPADLNFGIRTTDPAFPVSDLYIHLRDE